MIKKSQFKFLYYNAEGIENDIKLMKSIRKNEKTIHFKRGHK